MRLNQYHPPPNVLIGEFRHQTNREEFLPANDKAEGPEGSKRYETTLTSSSIPCFTVPLNMLLPHVKYVS